MQALCEHFEYMTMATNWQMLNWLGWVHFQVILQGLPDGTVTVTVTKVFILRFLLKDRKRITESFTYIQRSPGWIIVLRRRLKDVVVDRWSW